MRRRTHSRDRNPTGSPERGASAWQIAEEAAGELAARFLGLRFPASDIPSQARALYADSKIRVLADVQALPDTLLPPLLPSGAPLDQSHRVLRGFSEVHRTYLKNMGVRATMSLPILCEGKLWGLIACHHHQPRVPPHHVRNTLRSICELVAEVSAMRIETLSQLATAQNALLLDQLLVKVHQAVLQDANIKAVLGHLLPDLLTAFHASALCVAIGDLKYVGGRTHSPTAQRTSYSLDRRGMSRCESPLRGRMRGRPAPAHAV